MSGLLNQLLTSRRSDLWVLLIMESIFTTGLLLNHHRGQLSCLVLTLAPIAILTGLFSNFGSPKNWWAAYFGTTMTVNTDRFEGQYVGKGDILREDVANWLRESNIKPYYKQNAFRYVFLRKKHAVMFKLAWG